MPKPWVMLHRCVNDSQNFNRLCAESYLGGLLYFRIMAAADELGRLCADPREVRRQTGTIDAQDEEVAEALDLIEKHELIARYTVDGEVYLVLCNHFEYQDTAWERISQRNSCPPPPDWEENHPAGLDDFLSRCGHQKQFPASRYGLADREVKPPTVAEPVVQLVAKPSPPLSVPRKIDFTSEIPACVQQDSGRPYEHSDIAQVFQAAMPRDAWEEKRSTWERQLFKLINSSTQTLTLTELYHLLLEYPPQPEDRYADKWLGRVKAQKGIADRKAAQNMTAEQKHLQSLKRNKTAAEALKEAR